MTETEALTKYDAFLWKQVHAFAALARRQTIPLDDLMQEARLAFLLHIRTHDESMWAACTTTIKGALFDYVRRNHPLSISYYGFSRKLTEGTLYVSFDQIENEYAAGCEDDHSGIDLVSAIQRLSAKERELVGMRLEGLTVMEIADRMKTSHQRISYRLKMIRRKTVA